MGLIRLFLALNVVFDHFWAAILQPKGLFFPLDFKLGMNAGFAVMFFYIVSGFLISFALSNKYKSTSDGTLSFYEGRFSRIFSLYWPVVVLALIVYGPARYWMLHSSLLDHFAGMFLFGLDWTVSFYTYPVSSLAAAVPGIEPGWTLGAEVTFYLLAPWLLRSSRAAFAVLLISASVRGLSLFFFGYHQVWQYTGFPGTVVFFMLGHFGQTAGARYAALRSAWFSFPSLVASATLSWFTPYRTWDSLSFWVVILLFAVSLPGVFRSTKDSRVLNFFGDLSFPVYLLHTLVLVTVFKAYADTIIAILPANSALAGALLTVTYVASVLLASVLIHVVIERPAERRLRSALKSLFLVVRGRGNVEAST